MSAQGDRTGAATVTARRDYGPVQLAEYLYQVYGPGFGGVDNARYFGLLPEPDRGGGRRWSAAVVEQIRARWPEISAASRCVGAYGLKERGWTEAMIRDLLGEPDRYVDNPHYKSSGQMRLWRLQRAEAAEAGAGVRAAQAAGRPTVCRRTQGGRRPGRSGKRWAVPDADARQ